MSLRSSLEDILPDILPSDPREAIKGTELIRLVRMKLKGNYSDASLRYHFSFMAAEPDSEIAKVLRGQGYYRRIKHRSSEKSSRGLLPLFTGEGHEDAAAIRAKALALVVRQYDTTGQGVFVFTPPDGERQCWSRPDLAVVDWPEGEWDGNSLVFDENALERRRIVGAPMVQVKSVCMALMTSGDELRQEFFRTLSSSGWAQVGELVIVGDMPDEGETEDLRRLAADYGIGVVCMEVSYDRLSEMPSAEEIFRASEAECANLLTIFEPVRLATGRTRPRGAEMGEIISGEFGALFDWMAACLERGRVDEFEFRVSSY